jgi:hypothetical protein
MRAPARASLRRRVGRSRQGTEGPERVPHSRPARKCFPAGRIGARVARRDQTHDRALRSDGLPLPLRYRRSRRGISARDAVSALATRYLSAHATRSGGAPVNGAQRRRASTAQAHFVAGRSPRLVPRAVHAPGPRRATQWVRAAPRNRALFDVLVRWPDRATDADLPHTGAEGADWARRRTSWEGLCRKEASPAPTDRVVSRETTFSRPHSRAARYAHSSGPNLSPRSPAQEACAPSHVSWRVPVSPARA